MGFTLPRSDLREKQDPDSNLGKTNSFQVLSKNIHLLLFPFDKKLNINDISIL